MSKLPWFILLAVAVAAAWWYTRDPVEVAYQKCMKQVEASMAGSQSTGSEAEKAIADAMKGMGQAMGQAACDAMRSACQDNRDSAVCKAAIAQF